MPYVTSGDLRIHYEVEGEGPPLVLHTGFVGAARDWYDLGYVDALKEDYLLILPDPRGQGESDKPHSTEAYAGEKRAQDVIAVLDALKIDRTHFWGYSMGGGVGFQLAARHPERLISLVLGGAHPFGGPANAAQAELFRQGMATALAAIEAATSPLPPQLRNRWVTNDPEAMAAATLIERANLEAYVGTIELPTLMYCGDRDPIHEGAQKAANAIGSATFVSLPGLNHIDGILDKDAILPHVRAFLNRYAASPVTTAP